ncbi:MAG TPA: hypothetical protein VD907_06555, partial [Verrucomicrobiae bacterium]|nr:hypothetical protein [Verrucomicrobiae bacterium]
LAAIAVLLVGWAIWLQIMPHPLGDKLEYVGKEDYGSWLPLSSTRPASEYFYATNLSKEEVPNYFRGARLERPIEVAGSDYRIWLGKDNTTILLRYYQDELILKKYSQGKKGVIGISSLKYDSLKDALNE